MRLQFFLNCLNFYIFKVNNLIDLYGPPKCNGSHGLFRYENIAGVTRNVVVLRNNFSGEALARGGTGGREFADNGARGRGTRRRRRRHGGLLVLYVMIHETDTLIEQHTYTRALL